MARPTKLDEDLIAKLDEIADDQWSIKDACAAIGIGETTWRRWENSDSDDDLVAAFRRVAARVRSSSGEKLDQLAWGTLRGAMEDPGARVSDKVTAAAAALRLRTAHRVELTGRGGGPVESRTMDLDLSKLSTSELRTLHELTSKAERHEGA